MMSRVGNKGVVTQKYKVRTLDFNFRDCDRRRPSSTCCFIGSLLWRRKMYFTWGAPIMLFVESAEVMEEKSAETGVEWEPENIKQFEAQWLTLSNINCLTFRIDSDSTNGFWGNRAFLINISKPVNNSFLPQSWTVENHRYQVHRCKMKL